MRSFRTRDEKCVKCGHRLNGAYEVGGEHQPSPGDISVCERCGELSLFGDDMYRRPITPEEWQEIPVDQRIYLEDLQQAVRSREIH